MRNLFDGKGQDDRNHKGAPQQEKGLSLRFEHHDHIRFNSLEPSNYSISQASGTKRDLRFRLFPLQFAGFCQQRHGVHQVLQRDDADQALVFDDGDDAGIAGGKFAEG